MTPEAFITARLQRLREKPHDEPHSGELAERIFKQVMSKKFRKYSVSPEDQIGIRRAIEINISKGLPIKFLWPFGGYKLWRLEEAPEVDWAELFTLMYLSSWLRDVAASYEPGIDFVFHSDEMIVERINNVSEAETRAYAESLQRLFEFISKYLPDNFRFSLVPMRSHFDATDFAEQLATYISKERQKYQQGYMLPEDVKHTIELNVRLGPGQADSPRWREENDIVHMAYLNLTDPFIQGDDVIGVFPTNIPVRNYIAVGTTKTSIAKFWVGVGALKPRDNSLIETILSPSQLEQATFEWSPIHIEGLEGKNFNSIRVLRKA